MTSWEVVAILCVYVVGFFATAGAAGTDIASNCRNDNDVHIGGITGILLPTVLAGEVTMLIVAGAYGGDMVQKAHIGNYNPVELMSDILQTKFGADARRDDRQHHDDRFGDFVVPGGVFFVADRRQQLQDDDAEGQSALISVGVGALAAIVLAVTRLDRQRDQRFRGDRGFVRARLRRDAGRFPDGRPKMVRPEGRVSTRRAGSPGSSGSSSARSTSWCRCC